jgi:sugar phosphate isomerase/epimerase
VDDPPEAEEARMDELEIGLCWGTLQRASLLELIEAAGRHGFPTLSVQPEAVISGVEALGEAGLRKRLRDAGVRVRVLDAIWDALPGQGPADGSAPRSNEEAAYRAGEAVEAPMLNMTHYRGRPTPRGALVEAIGGVCRRAAARGFDIVLEFIPDTGLPSLTETFAIIRDAGEKNCAINLDPWHLTRSAGTVEQVRALPQGAIGAYQLCDRTPPAPGTVYVPMSGRDLPGEGQAPLCDLTRAIVANNPRITAELEVFSEELKAMTVDAAAARAAAAVKAWRTSCG